MNDTDHTKWKGTRKKNKEINKNQGKENKRELKERAENIILAKLFTTTCMR